MLPVKLKKDKITRRYKDFAFYVGIGLVTFTVFSCFVPESVSARTFDIRDDYGRVTTEGWWLVNILAPFFVTFEFIKIALGILCLPLAIFGFREGQELLSAGWSNLTVMWPGLLFWFLVLVLVSVVDDATKEVKPGEDKPEEDK